MPQESQISHRNVRNTALPYRSNVSPTSTDPCFVSGSQDLMTSIAGYAERRPGFADAVETTPTVFNNLQRLFTWDKPGYFVVMACDINQFGQAAVYKLVEGTDSSFVNIATDASSAVPYDFVTSNGTVYFSNGNTSYKWDPINGLSKWGIAVGDINSASGPNAPTLAASLPLGGHPWANPTNIEVQDGVFATVTLAAGQTSDYLRGTNYGFSIPAANTIVGIQIGIKGKVSLVSDQNSGYVQLLKGGVPIGNIHQITWTTSNAFVNSGSSSDLWGTNWTYNDINATNFGAVVWTQNFSGSVTWSIDYYQITVFSAGGPTVTLTGTGLTASVGWQYVYTYGNSATGHISSPTPPSNVVKPTNQQMRIPVVASTDPQVNQIHVYRSTDSVASGTNAAIYYELPNSPFTNTNQTVSDAALDTQLLITNIAPYSGFNDPPPPFVGMTYYSGRIYGVTLNKSYFSSLEECIAGVPEESFVSGVGGNYWTFDQVTEGLAVAGTLDSQVLITFCPGRLYGITGTTLDTFRRFQVTSRRGTRNRTTVTTMGGMAAWLDSANQIWVANGTSLQEISQDIRPDLANINPAVCSMTFHAQGGFHWLVFSTGTKIFVYDLDLEQWMPPWSFACNYIFSGEIGPGNYKLMACTTTKAVMLSTTAHNDNGIAYTPIAQTNLFPVIPDFGSRFSYMAMGMYDEPSRTGYPTFFQVDTNNVALSDVKFVADDDPLNASTTYTSIFAQAQPITVLNRNNGQFLVQRLYTLNQPSARWIGWQIKGLTADDNLRIYDFYMGYKAAGGR